MKYRNLFLLLIFSMNSLFSAPQPVRICETDLIPSFSDPKKQREAFLEVVKKLGKQKEYARVMCTLSCGDTDSIPKDKDAGKVFGSGENAYQVMHNGMKIVKDSSCGGPWMTDVIYALKGHHEPQEEKVFYEVLKAIPKGGVMLELGSDWAYYSIWFAQQVPEATIHMVEPDPERLEMGKRNCALNHITGNFYRGYFGAWLIDAGDTRGAKQLAVDSFLKEHAIDHVTILHSDIQGNEYAMLQTAEQSISAKKIDYFFLSTHSEILHFACLNFLKNHNYTIIAEHSPQESFTVDGLIVAKRQDVLGPTAISISKK